MSRAPVLLVLLAVALPSARAGPGDLVDAAYEEARATLDHYTQVAAQALADEEARARSDGSAWSDATTDGCYDAQAGEATRREGDAHDDLAEAEASASDRGVAFVEAAGNFSRGEGAGPDEMVRALGLPERPPFEELRNATDAAVLDAVATSVILLQSPGATACMLGDGLSNRTRELAHDDLPATTGLVDERTGLNATGVYAFTLGAAEWAAGEAGVDPYGLLTPPDVVGMLDPVFEALSELECELLHICPEDAP